MKNGVFREKVKSNPPPAAQRPGAPGAFGTGLRRGASYARVIIPCEYGVYAQTRIGKMLALVANVIYVTGVL